MRDMTAYLMMSDRRHEIIQSSTPIDDIERPIAARIAAFEIIADAWSHLTHNVPQRRADKQHIAVSFR